MDGQEIQNNSNNLNNLEEVLVKKKSKLPVVISMIAAAIVFSIAGCLMLYTTVASPEARARAQLKAGQRYLEEYDYERAIAAFEKAIEIEPKCEEAYIGAADAYLAIADELLEDNPSEKDREKAEKYYERVEKLLERGYKKTESEVISARMLELTDRFDNDDEEQKNNTEGAKTDDIAEKLERKKEDDQANQIMESELLMSIAPDALYPGAKDANDSITYSLLQHFQQQNEIDESKILMVNVDDFENIGIYSAFIFVGTHDDEEGTFFGSLWFTDGDYCENLTGENCWWKIDGTIKYDSRKYVYVDEYFSSGAISLIYEVVEGEARKCNIYGIGEAHQIENGDVAITVSRYDMMSDDSGDFTGHTWKPYYFFYSKEHDRMEEYVGNVLTYDEANELAGFDIISQIENIGGKVGTAYYRGNGILNVNYQVKDADGYITYLNANFDCNNGTFIDAWGTGEYTLERSSYGGTYFERISAE